MRGPVAALFLIGTTQGTTASPVDDSLAFAGFPPIPEYCAPLYTVQKRLCEVQHVYRCDANGQTEWISVSLDTDDSLLLERSDAEGNTIDVWQDTGKLFFGYIENADAVSLSAARAEGSDTFDQTVLVMVPPFLDPLPTHMVGQFTRTSETLVLNDVTFERFALAVTMGVNSVVINFSGDMMVDRSSGAMVESSLRVEAFGAVFKQNGALAQVIHPGESGFLGMSPAYDCDATSDAAPDRRPA
ncbi:MAG: hypothetical protein KDK24_07770 [Pseudooceanicola sp.]|nr:hypothetical protein [Pseudooceanicola sp.]